MRKKRKAVKTGGKSFRLQVSKPAGYPMMADCRRMSKLVQKQTDDCFARKRQITAAFLKSSNELLTMMNVSTTSDDAELLQLMRVNNEQAFSAIYTRYWKILYTTANAILQSDSAAQDIVQVVFVDLWERRQKVEIQSLKAYLQQATRFQVFKAIKAKKTDTAFYDRLARITADIVYENPSRFVKLEKWLADTLAELPPDCQSIFKMSREQQMTYKQIAAQLQISEKTVEKKMTISLKHIRHALQKDSSFMVLVLFLYQPVLERVLS